MTGKGLSGRIWKGVRASVREASVLVMQWLCLALKPACLREVC